jgi:membrane-bound lytic murein transglycosylase D
VRVMFQTADGAQTARELTGAFRLGRGEECAVRFPDREISRTHSEVYWQDGGWWVRDLQSTNGTYLDGVSIERAKLEGAVTLRLGSDGPEIRLEVVAPVASAAPPAAEDAMDATEIHSPRTMSFYRQHYLEGDATDPAGPRTIMIRQAFVKAVTRRRRIYLAIIAAVAFAGTGAGLLSLHQHQQLARNRQLAEDLFYNMKELQLKLSVLAARVAADDTAARPALEAGRVRVAELQHSYDRFLEELKIYKADVPEEQRLVLRVARVFGECEVAMPPDLLHEVDRYIDKWKADQRLSQAIARAKGSGYASLVVSDMVKDNLPPQFFYVALQESDFKLDVCGPKTRWGIAKGPWQFMPSTAVAYGLHLGPLYLLRKSDPRDDRHDFVRSTHAAAAYLRDLYNNDAQGSGLLTVASYNWGQNNVLDFIRTLPENPRERNFWRLLMQYRRKVPRETYNYVFRIFSAAVIGENPKLFGFDFDNPLVQH